MQTQPSKLIKVEARLLKSGRMRYTGHFENGHTHQIRESYRLYHTVAQLHPTTYSQGHEHYVRDGEPVGELVFSADEPRLGPRQRTNLITVCVIEVPEEGTAVYRR